MNTRCSLLLTIVLMGCGEGRSESPPSPEVHAPRRHSGVPRHRAEATSHAEPDALARSSRGSHDAGEVLEGPLTLDLRGGARIDLLEGARAMLLDEAPAQLVLSSGALHVVLAPMGNSTRPPLRIGAPQGTLFIGGSVDAWAMVNPSGATWFAITSGRAECVIGDGEPAELHAGQSIVAGSTEAGAGPTNEAGARAMLQTLIEDGELVYDQGASMRELEPAALLLESLWTESVQLRERHRTADGPAKREALRALAANGQRTEQARRALLVRYERAAAWAMRGELEAFMATRTRIRRALRL